jgi:nitrite reductase/ring-hydroxylating ferredoxin subunit
MNLYLRHSPAAATPVSRRTLLVGAGLAAAALGGLSACGADSPAPPSGSGAVSAKTSDIPVGGGTIFTDAKTVITQPTAGTYKAFSSICTHAGCPVAQVSDSIDCNCHGSKFSLTDGSVLAGPAQSPLPAKTVTVQGDSLAVTG